MRVPQSDDEANVISAMQQLSRVVRVKTVAIPAGASHTYQVSADCHLVCYGDLRELVSVRDAEYGCEVCWGLEEWFPTGCVTVTLPVGSVTKQVLTLFEGQIAFESELFSDGVRVKQFIEFYRVTDAQRAIKLMPHVMQACHLCHHDRESLFGECQAEEDPNEVVIERIKGGLDMRTTCMIRNIPNKYTQSMLIEWLNEDLWGEYDFIYLRMDFKNHCNVGYAFINFVNPQSIVKLASKCVGRRWPRFNSEKLGRLSYARIQGLGALLEKFRHSQVMQEPANYRPKCFYTEGPHRGEEQPLF